jgi:replicative DNA helicase
MARYVGTRRNVAGECGQVACIFTEMSGKEAVERMVLELAQLDSHEARRNVTAETIEKAAKALRILWQSGVVLFDAVGKPVEIITATIHKFKASNANARLVVVDNLSGIGGRAAAGGTRCTSFTAPSSATSTRSR